MADFKTNSMLMVAIFLWASAFVGIKLALVSYSPGSLALLRFLVASLCMAPFYYRQPQMQRVMPWNVRIPLIVAGMAGIGVYNICLNYGELSVAAGIASFIIGLMPIFTILLAVFFFKERLSAAAWFSIFLSLLGLLLMTFGEHFSMDLMKGMLLILISTMMSSIATIIKKGYLKIYSSISVISWVIWGGTLLLFIYFPDLMVELPKADYQSTMVVIYMGIFPAALAYLAWGYVLKRVNASKAAITLYALPFASTLLGFILLQETPSLISMVGGVIALLGAVLANQAQDKSSNEVVLNDKIITA